MRDRYQHCLVRRSWGDSVYYLVADGDIGRLVVTSLVVRCGASPYVLPSS